MKHIWIKKARSFCLFTSLPAVDFFLLLIRNFLKETKHEKVNVCISALQLKFIYEDVTKAASKLKLQRLVDIHKSVVLKHTAKAERMKSSNFAVRCFEKFSTTTVIRVFNFIRISEFLVERLFWIVVLLVSSYATIQSVVQTFDKFMAEYTVSVVTYVANSTTGLTFNDAVMCIETRPALLLSLYTNEIDSVLAYVTNQSDLVQDIKNKIHKAHVVENQRNALAATLLNNLSAADSSRPIFQWFHAFDTSSSANVFSPVEVALFGLMTAMFSRIVGVETNYKQAYVTWQSDAIDRLHQAFALKAIDFGELFTLTIEVTCTLLQIRITTSRYSQKDGSTQYSVYDLCKHGQASLSYFGTYVKSEAICYRFPQSENMSLLRFYSPFDWVEISIHPESLYASLFAELRYIDIDLEGGYKPDQQPLQARFNAKQSVEFTFETINTAVDLRRRECARKDSRRGTYSDCVYWCRFESIVRACSCTPISKAFVSDFARHLPESNSSCTFMIRREGDTCANVLAADYDETLQNCSERCRPNCETLLFSHSVHPVTASKWDDANANTTVVQLKSTKFVYQRVDEHHAMDFLDLIASLGGNLSLYLGASFLALIHVVVFVFRLPFERSGTANIEETGVKQLEGAFGLFVRRFSALEERVDTIREERCFSARERLRRRTFHVSTKDKSRRRSVTEQFVSAIDPLS